MKEMQCPVCSSKLQLTSLDNDTVHSCRNCQGTWFKEGQLTAAINHTKPEGSVPNYASSSKQLDCPECNSTVVPTEYAHDSGIPVNHCLECNGIWLSNGQLQQIAHYRSKVAPSDDLARALRTSSAGSRRGYLVEKTIRSRTLSAATALVLLGITLLSGGNVTAVLQSLMILVLPMACIWFPDELGSVTGFRFGLVRPTVGNPTPGIFVALGGWVLLLSFLLVSLFSILYQ